MHGCHTLAIFKGYKTNKKINMSEEQIDLDRAVGYEEPEVGARPIDPNDEQERALAE